jgi:hypothetical protein
MHQPKQEHNPKDLLPPPEAVRKGGHRVGGIASITRLEIIDQFPTVLPNTVRDNVLNVLSLLNIIGL